MKIGHLDRLKDSWLYIFSDFRCFGLEGGIVTLHRFCVCQRTRDVASRAPVPCPISSKCQSRGHSEVGAENT